MGQTAEEIRDNIVRIVDGSGTTLGTGFFVKESYCVTCHHNICNADVIKVIDVKGKEYPAQWMEQFSDKCKDIAVLKVENSSIKRLECKKETYQSIPVMMRGFPLDSEGHNRAGEVRKGILSELSEPFYWQEAEISGGNGWNDKPAVDVYTYTFEGEFVEGFSGAPVCYELDKKIVGMFEAKDDKVGYVIPIEHILERFPSDKQAIAPVKPLDTQTMLVKGNELYAERKYLEAINCYDDMLQDINYLAALVNKGRSLSQLGRNLEAQKIFEVALEINPNYAMAWNGKGNALGGLKQYDEAMKCYDRAIELDPNDVSSWSNKGASLYKLEQYDEAIKCYDRAIELDPNDAAYWNNKGNVLQKMEKEKESERCFKKARELR